ncbi:MAG: hypothetical protein LDL41_24750 [Coleofasciculus sp. S288]|nr:hypothetical protein [Coleofasciculus sp. S288]
MVRATQLITTVPLSRKDRDAIAAVLTWDLCKTISPDEIEAIRVSGEWVTVRLSFQRAVPIHREVFRSIRQQQSSALN